MPTPRVFICYRRDDAPGHAGRLYDWVKADLGAENVFLDVKNIAAGTPFAERIRSQMAKCTTCLVVIGPRWLDTERAVSPHVAAEVAHARKRGLHVVPVLVFKATMPKASALPADIQQLADLHAANLHDERWEEDVQRLLKELKSSDVGKIAGERKRERLEVWTEMLGTFSHDELGDQLPSPLPRTRAERAAQLARRSVTAPAALLETFSAESLHVLRRRLAVHGNMNKAAAVAAIAGWLDERCPLPKR
jgi:hypothetical protein